MISTQEETLNPNKTIKNPEEIYWLFRGWIGTRPEAVPVIGRYSLIDCSAYIQRKHSQKTF